jgi:signal transduction histidine kinase/ActR/RegA family two-component response regulator
MEEKQSLLGRSTSARELSAVELAVALGEVAMSVNASRDLDAILERIFIVLGRCIPYDSAAIFLLQDDILIVAGSRGFPADLPVQDVVLPWHSGTTHYPVIAENRALVIEDVQTDPGWQTVAGYDLVRAWIGAPLSVEQRVIGMLTIDRWQPGVYSDHDVALAQAFASHIAIAIHNAQLYADSQRANKELQSIQAELFLHERLYAIGELALGSAHDFNNTLAGILGNVQLLLQDAVDPSIQSGLRVIERAARDGAVTIRRLQDFVRTSPAGPMAPVDLRGVAESALALTRPRWQGLPAPLGADISVATELTSVYTAPVEAAALRQVLTNLILNALDAMPHGGTLRVATGTHEQEAFVLVQDTGIGIAPELLTRIFKPFVTTKGTRGSGMGLAMSQAIVTRQGGRMTVESALGEGSVFTVWLPLGTSVPIEKPPAPPSTTAAHRILVVDDDQELCHLVGRALRSRGHHVVTASSALEALALIDAEQDPYDLVVTDLSMPSMSGWELIRRIRERDQTIGVTLMSGWGQEVIEAIANHQLIDQSLSKPFDLQELHQHVATALDAVVRRRALVS